MEVEVVDASTAMATNSARAYSDAQLGLVWARILAAHFGVDATRANNDAIQILLNEPLLKATIKGFAPTCERYHKAIGDHAMMNRTRNRQASANQQSKTQAIEASEAAITSAFQAASVLDLHAASIADQAHARLSLQSLAATITSHLSSLPSKYKPISKNKEHLLKQSNNRAKPGHSLRHQRLATCVTAHNSCNLSWDEAFSNITEATHSGLSSSYNGPLSTGELVQCMQDIRHSSVQALSELDCEATAKVVAQICYAAPVVVMQQSQTTVFIDVHAIVDQDAIAAEFFGIVLGSGLTMFGPGGQPAQAVPRGKAGSVANGAEAEGIISGEAEGIVSGAEVGGIISGAEAGGVTSGEAGGVVSGAEAEGIVSGAKPKDAVRRKRGRPKGETAYHNLFPDLVEIAMKHVVNKSWGAQARRHDATCDATGVEIGDLRDYIMKHVAGVHDFVMQGAVMANKGPDGITEAQMSTCATKDLFMPAHAGHHNAKRAHSVIPAKVPQKRNQNSKDSNDQHTCAAQVKMGREFALDPEFEAAVVRTSWDTMVKLKVGVLAVSRFHQIRRRFMVTRVQGEMEQLATSDTPNYNDHDFPHPGYFVVTIWRHVHCSSRE
jgi:hypothetical protein